MEWITILMLWFNLLVIGHLLALAVFIVLDYHARLRLSRVATFCEKLVPLQPSRNGHVAHAAQRIIGLSAEVAPDGVHLEFYQPPNRRGATSPILSLVSTRQHDRDGTIYAMATANGSLYLVSMSDERARQVLGTFYAWKNGCQEDEKEADKLNRETERVAILSPERKRARWAEWDGQPLPNFT